MTIDRVARDAGVGVGTVSRVLNGHPHVAERTRRRVLDVIDALGYRPDHAAASLPRLRRTRSIAVLVPFLTRPSVVARLAGVLDVLGRGAWDPVVYDVSDNEQLARRIDSLARPHRADGVLVVSLRLTRAQVAALRSAQVPLVVVDADVAGVARLVIDDVEGGRLATTHLLGLGHRRIGFVGDDGSASLRFDSSDLRLRGHLDALSAAGVATPPSLVALGPHDRAEAAKSAAGLLRSARPPTAVFAASDTQAAGVLEAAELVGLGVPGDLSVIGFDDVDTASLLHLTTVRQPLYESGRAGAELLCSAVEGSRPRPGRRLLPLEVLVRRTTATPRRRRRGPTHPKRKDS